MEETNKHPNVLRILEIFYLSTNKIKSHVFKKCFSIVEHMNRITKTVKNKPDFMGPNKIFQKKNYSLNIRARQSKCFLRDSTSHYY